MKPEVVFGLESAAWPALLVSAGGAVLLTNAAAQKFFGLAPDSGDLKKIQKFTVRQLLPSAFVAAP